MVKNNELNDLTKLLNIIGLVGITLIIITAFIFQFILNELPCPLCLLQRIGLLAIGFGFLLNIHYEIRPLHYALSLLAAVLTAFVALRQVTLHIAPNTQGYGSAIFGIHMYTWVFILCVIANIYLAIILSIPIQYHFNKDKEKISEAKTPLIRKFGHLVFSIYIFIIVVNIISAFLECGFQECPENPIIYKLF